MSLAATSIVGTIIPQYENPAAYLQTYGEFLYRTFDILDFFDMYHSFWFQLMIVLLVLNIIACSVDRLSATWKIIFVKHPVFNLSRFQNQSDKQTFAHNRLPEYLKSVYGAFAGKRFGYVKTEDTANGFCVFSEKWRWTRLGVYFVHLSILLLLIGSLIGSIFGFDGYVNIEEGQSVSAINLSLEHAGKTKPLGFDILCEDFDVAFYDSGMAKEFRSSLTIMENGQPVYKKDIIVNDPIRYKGINIFQSSYGPIKPKHATLKFTSTKTDMVYNKKVLFDEETELPEGNGRFVLIDYSKSYNFRGQVVGEAFMGNLTHDNGDVEGIVLPMRYPAFDRMRKGEIFIEVAEYEKLYYTGLQVTKDPGVWVVYAGFMMMIIGCYITFFMPHQRFCINVVKKGNQSVVMIAGTSNKNKLGMQNKVKKFSEKLAKL